MNPKHVFAQAGLLPALLFCASGSAQSGGKPAAETELARVAAGMKPGTWMELRTANYTPELLKVQNGNILGYTDTASYVRLPKFPSSSTVPHCDDECHFR